MTRRRGGRTGRRRRPDGADAPASAVPAPPAGSTGDGAPLPTPPARERLLAAIGFALLVVAVHGEVWTPRGSLVYSSNWNPFDPRPLEQNYGPGFDPADQWERRHLSRHANLHDPGATLWQWEPAAELLRRALWSGELPFWDPYSGAGAPAMANLTPALLFPPYLVVVALGNAVFLKDLYFLGLLWAAGWFTWLWLRGHGIGTAAAFFGGSAFLLGGGLNQNVGSFIGQTAACLPFALWLSRWYLDRTSWRRAALLAIGYAAISLASFPPLLLAAFGLSAAYVATHLAASARGDGWRSVRRPAARYAVGVALALALVGFYYLPAARLVAATPQIEASYRDAALQHVGPGSLFDLLSPVLADGHKVWADPPIANVYEPVLFYVGPLPLLAALFARRTGQGRRGPLLAFLLGSTIFIALKLLGVAPAQWIAHLPVLDAIHFAQYFSIPLGFLIAALGAVGVETLRIEGVSWAKLAVVAVLGAAVLSALWEIGREAGVFTHRLARVWVGEWRELRALAAGGFALAVAMGSAALRRRIPPVGLAWALVALLAVQGFAYDRYPRQQDWNVWKNPPPYAAALVERTDWERVYTVDAFHANAGAALETFTMDSLHTFNPPRVYELYRRYFNPRVEPFLRGTDALPPEGVLDAAAIGALAFTASGEPLAREALARGHRSVYRDGYALILERPTAPRFFFTADYATLPVDEILAAVGEDRPPRRVLVDRDLPFPPSPGAEGRVEVIDFGLGRYTLAVVAPSPGLVYSADSYFEGWTARVDGEPAEILPANHAFRAVVVPAGRSVVRFRYWPPGLTLGLALSGAAALAIGWILWGRRLAVRKGRPAEPAPG